MRYARIEQVTGSAVSYGAPVYRLEVGCDGSEAYLCRFMTFGEAMAWARSWMGTESKEAPARALIGQYADADGLDHSD